MAFFPTAAQARERGQNNRIILEEVSILEIAVQEAVASNALSVEYGGSISDSSATSVTINGAVISASPMTNNDVTGQAYYNVQTGSTVDAAILEQMNEVTAHFEAKGYSISRLTSNFSTFYWRIQW